MTEATIPSPQPEAAEFVQLWADTFSQVLGQITGSAQPCAVAETADLPPAAESDLWALVACSGARRGEMSVRVTAASALRLAQIFMSEPATPEASLTEDHRQAVLELLRQISGIVVTGAKARWGEVQLRVELAAAPSWPSAATSFLQVGEPGATATALECALSAALVAALKVDKSASGKAEAASEESVPSAAPEESRSASSSSVASSSIRSAEQVRSPDGLDRLMDVQLSMTLRFGARTMLLREVLDLGPGAVVELERKIQDPVDLLLDGKLIARGEVVVIEGNYGLRVTDVSPLGP